MARTYPKGISNVSAIWKMAGNVMLPMIPVLEIRATDWVTPAAVDARSLTSAAYVRASSSALLSSNLTAETIQTPFTARRKPTAAAIATGISSSRDSGHSWHVVPAVKNPRTQTAQPFPPVPVWHSPLEQREPAGKRKWCQKAPQRSSSEAGHDKHEKVGALTLWARDALPLGSGSGSVTLRHVERVAVLTRVRAQASVE